MMMSTILHPSDLNIRNSHMKSQILQRKASKTREADSVRQEFIAEKGAEKKDLVKITKQLKVSII